MTIHINSVQDIASAWRSGKPIAALCGFIRVLAEEKHDGWVKDPGDVCADCSRISTAWAATGQGTAVGAFKSVEEIKELAAPPAMWTGYTFSINGSQVWNS